MNLDTLKKKRTADEAFEEYEYVYGIVTTGEKMTSGGFCYAFASLTHFTIS
jgi:hypothetical protein